MEPVVLSQHVWPAFVETLQSFMDLWTERKKITKSSSVANAQQLFQISMAFTRVALT